MAPVTPRTTAEAGAQLETFVLRNLLQASGAFKAPGSSTALYTDMFVDALAAQVAAHGGLGLAKTVEKGLRPPLAHTEVDAILNGAGHVSSTFGLREDPLEGGIRMHDGVDIAAAEGTPIHAAQAGVVTVVGNAEGYGNHIVIAQAGGANSVYAHAQDVRVVEGQHVRAGDVVATVGSTGRSTGPHLHFEMRQGGAPVDPLRALNAWNRVSISQRENVDPAHRRQR